MNNKQKIINEIKNGEKKDYYQACMKKGIPFDIVVDEVNYYFYPNGIWVDHEHEDNPYLKVGATATWSKDKKIKTYNFKASELKFVWAEKRDNWIDHLISIIPANITEEQRKAAVKWIKSGNWDLYTIEDEVKTMQPWDNAAATDEDDVLATLGL